MTYTDVFTGDTISPSSTGLTELAITADVELYWPLEAEPNSPLLSSIVQINSSDQASRVITLPDARSGSEGYSVLFNNLSAQTVLVKDQGANTVRSMPTATQWVIYLNDNSTANGTWKSYQLGATTTAADATSLAGAGLKADGSTLAQKLVTTTKTISYTIQTTDRAGYLVYTGTGGGQSFTLPTAVAAGSDWFVHVRNNSTADLMVVRAGSDTINGATSLTFHTGDSAIIASDGTSAFTTIGFGQEAEFAFDYVVVDVSDADGGSGGGDYTLKPTELNRVAYKFIGTLSGNRSVIVPATVQQYWLHDTTTRAAYTLTVGTATQVTPLTITSGVKSIYYCDGSDVVEALSLTIAADVDGGVF